MKILYYHPFSGISGDMNMAAMIDLGVNTELLQLELAKLNLSDEFELKITRDERLGIYGTRVDVVIKEHHQTHENHNHHHSHRHLKDIEEIVNNSSLSEEVKATSIQMFHRVAEAEAKIHGSTKWKVHFHEVGATDSIVDVIGAAICFHQLEIDEVWCAPIELGGGFVQCAHGMMPVPAPATAEILAGVPTTQGAVQKETTTPTGATILKTLVNRYDASPTMTVQKTAYGIGHRNTKIPNVLRVQLAEVALEIGVEEEAYLLSCNIDDMTAEILGSLVDDLLTIGAQDVDLTPVLMKKNRPATKLNVLCAKKDISKIKSEIFRLTTTLGIKIIPVTKSILPRTTEIFSSSFGDVTIKSTQNLDNKFRAKVEFEDCKRIASETGKSIQEVNTIIQSEIIQHL